MLTASQAAMYRQLTLGDDAVMTSMLVGGGTAELPLDGRTTSLVRLAALIVSHADEPAYQREVGDAINRGATPDQITAVLVAVARVAGSSVVMSAAPKLALALGYDVEAAFEEIDGP